MHITSTICAHKYCIIYANKLCLPSTICISSVESELSGYSVAIQAVIIVINDLTGEVLVSARGQC